MESRVEIVDVRYDEPVYEMPGRRLVGSRSMECKVKITLDMAAIAFGMGGRACRSKSGKCQDGAVTVTRVGTPKVISRRVDAPAKGGA